MTAKRPLLLDLFCGAGGCAVGYHRAGFDVVGIDIKPQPRYPFPFAQGNAITMLRDMMDANDSFEYRLCDFAAIHASPPCQAYSRTKHQSKPAPKLIPIVRQLLMETGKPWVIENVEGAPLFFAVVLCGASFGLGASGRDLPRHRIFESSHLLMVPDCVHRRGQTIGVYGNGTNKWHREKFGRNLTESDKRTAMGIDWMSRAELTQAIPPAYTEYLGRQLLGALANV